LFNVDDEDVLTLRLANCDKEFVWMGEGSGDDGEVKEEVIFVLEGDFSRVILVELEEEEEEEDKPNLLSENMFIWGLTFN
jgi:hypothetical protein